MKKPNNKIEISVATRIMGWRWYDNGLSAGHNIQHWIDENNNDMGWYFAPHESIESAIKVVQKVSEKTKYYALAWAQSSQIFATFSRDRIKGAFASLAATNGSVEKAQCLASCRAAWKITQQEKLQF